MEHDLRIVILGKTGVGKSTLGNTVFGKTCAFVTAHDLQKVAPCTRKCQWMVGKQFGTTLEVTDTVGASDLEIDEREVYAEIATWLRESAPGPHVVLFVLDCSRLTTEDRDIFQTLKSLFTPDICKYVIFVFNKIDHYRRPGEPNTLEFCRQRLAKQLEASNTATLWIQELLREVSNNYIGMTNLASDSERTSQARELNLRMKALKESNQNGFFPSEDMMPTVKSNLKKFILDSLDTRSHNEAAEEAEKIMQKYFPDRTSRFEAAKKGALRSKERATNKCIIL